MTITTVGAMAFALIALSTPVAAQSGDDHTFDSESAQLPWEPAIGERLVKMLPSGKRVDLLSLGSESDQKVVDAYQLYLESRGFIVSRTSLIDRMPWAGELPAGMSNHQITVGNRNTPRIVVVIAPSIIRSHWRE